jgi:uncharacterized Fe-S cluster-containing radical SAM superfamily protein
VFDPVQLAEITRKDVCKGNARKYYRFRPSRFYGGISTADCVGCCLRCVFCWAWKVIAHPKESGRFNDPENVAMLLQRTAEKKRLRQIRISGNEPTICREHLLKVLGLIDTKYLFILETNGILIGNDQGYAKALARFQNLLVRVSLKGTCEEEFSKLTGAIPEGFQLQLKALENLVRSKVRCQPACMISFSPPENIRSLRKRLKAVRPDFEDFEAEELILYPHIEERLRKLAIPYFTAYK